MQCGVVRLVSLLLCALLVFEAPMAAQAKPGLRIVVVDGEGAINNIQLGSGREPVVEVRDADDKPVPGAKVTFTLPDMGPSGTFFGASRKVTVTTNEQGRATGTGFRPNLQEGRFQIQVMAAANDQTATAMITQSNSMPVGGVSRTTSAKKRFGTGKIVAIAAAAGIIAAVAATRDSDETRPATVQGTTITPGTVSVGIPR